MNLFLGLLGLKVNHVGNKWNKDKKTYLYSLDRDLLQRNQEIVNRRKQFTDDDYSTLYWRSVHKENDIQTPVVIKVRDESGVHLVPLSDLEERFESMHTDSSQKAVNEFFTKLANED